MQFSTRTTSPGRMRAGCALVPVISGKELTAGGKELDAAHGGRLARAIRSGDLPAKAGATLLVGLDGALPRVLLVATGEAPELGERAFAEATRGALRAAGQLAADEVVSLLHEAPVAGRDLAWKLRAQVLIGREIAYRFDVLKTSGKNEAVRPKRVVLAAAAGVSAAVAQATAIANGVDMAKDLGNLPANHCTPTHLADVARKMARELGLQVEVLDARQMQALKMGALLSVARGSEQPPKLIVLRYRGAGARQPPVALIGKGITFDTGGISLKPAPEMDEMKYDMCGAASVLGTMRAVAELGLKINLVVVVPTTENMPSGRATKPGDVVTSMSGQTIEILNTDAEGRLILCDALTYVQRFKPGTVIDVATLTGACVIALGHHHSGLFSPDDALAAELQQAGREIGDSCWRMPLDDAYQDQLKSPFADMANIGGRPAGSVTAACFLSRFAKGYDWAHLDIAGTAWRSGAAKGATGRPVPLLASFLLARAKG